MSTDSGYNQETINGYTILTPKNQTPHIYKNYVPKQAYGMAADYLNRIRQERQQERGFLDDEGLGPKSLGVMNAAVDRDLAANYLGSLPREDVMRYLDPSTSRSVGRNYVNQDEDTESRQGRSGILKKIFQKAKKDGTVDYIKKDAEDEKFYDYEPAESNKRIDNYSGWHKSRPTLYIGDVSTDTAHSDQDFLTGAYRNYLGRDIGNEGRTYWGDQLSGGMSRDDVLSNIRKSSEFKDRFLGDAYQKLLGREIASEGRDYWGRMIDEGQSNQDVLDNIRRSDEYQEAFLQDSYKNLLGRDLGDKGRSYWKEQMRGGMSEDDVLKNIRLSQEYSDYFANNDSIDRVGDRDDEKKLIKGIDKQLPLKTAKDVAQQKLARTQQRYDDAWRDFSNNPRTEDVVGLNETPSWATGGLEDLLNTVKNVSSASDDGSNDGSNDGSTTVTTNADPWYTERKGAQGDFNANLRSNEGWSGTHWDKQSRGDIYDTGSFARTNYLTDQFKNFAGDDNNLTYDEYVQGVTARPDKNAYNPYTVSNALANYWSTSGSKVDSQALKDNDLFMQGDNLVQRLGTGDPGPNLALSDYVKFLRRQDDGDDDYFTYYNWSPVPKKNSVA